MRDVVNEKIIVALDNSNTFEQLHIVENLGDKINFYKIGLGSLSSGGLALANELKSMGKRIFLDLKLFDIGNTIETAVKGLSQFDLDFLTVHGDPYVIEAAVKGRDNTNLKILAVTFLTSLNRTDLNQSLIKDGEITDLVKQRASIAFAAGADGVICSAGDIKNVRELRPKTRKLIVTPGIRPKGISKDDQKRVGDPGEALRDGADFLVLGRPITASRDPAKNLEKITDQIVSSLNSEKDNGKGKNFIL